MNKLIEELDKYRLENKISQSELAKMLDVEFTTVNRWFAGRNQPNTIHEYHIRKLLAEKHHLAGL